ncbi:unnamed protein product [Trichogramma brassicae]|uniref:Ionotropic glutamate receptor L-glutamate and glycine-binding domain-containing protein n=1 Tax=Trichogramma brassicae TaxID=86971 RepID=A0A6H5IHV5_9HYME|nr:unnamed protein product [Trichogramma brassicae]
MFLPKFVFYYILSWATLIKKSSSSQLDVLVDTLNTFESYQVVVLLSNDNNRDSSSKLIDSICASISRVNDDNTLVLISSANFDDHNRYVAPRDPLLNSARRPLLINARQTSLLVVVLSFGESSRHEDLFDEFSKSLRFIVELSPRRARPYCLVMILVEAFEHPIPSERINELLLYAWRKQFLDLTIAQLYEDEGSTTTLLYSYNPFDNDYSMQRYQRGPTDAFVFPDKMRDMKQYPLKVSAVRRNPSLNYELDANGKIIDINGSDYGMALVLSQKLNFRISWVPFGISSYSQPLQADLDSDATILDFIINGSIDLGANQVYLHFAFRSKDRQGERAVSTWYDDYCALVPVEAPPAMARLRTGVIDIMLTVLGHVSFARVAAKLLRFSARHWEAHRVYQAILGSPTTRQPVRNAERLFFLCLIVVSFQYSLEIYSGLTKISLRQANDGPYHTLMDLARSNLTVEMNANHYNMTFDNCDGALKQLRAKIKFVQDPMSCPQRLLRHRNVACLMDRSVARSFVAEESGHGADDDGTDSNTGPAPRMKILREYLWTAPKGCILSEASPYIVEVSRVMRRILEAGLWNWWIIYDKRRAAPRRHSRMIGHLDECDRFLRSKLLIVWYVGIIASLVCFLGELVARFRLRDRVTRRWRPEETIIIRTIEDALRQVSVGYRQMALVLPMEDRRRREGNSCFHLNVDGVARFANSLEATSLTILDSRAFDDYTFDAGGDTLFVGFVGVGDHRYLFETFDEILRFLVKSSPSGSRPHSLFVIASREPIAGESTSRVLRYAWSLRFLDVSLLLHHVVDNKNTTTSSCDSLIFLTYDPFVDRVMESCYEPNITSIFPNKLRNMHGYPLKVLFVPDATLELQWLDPIGQEPIAASQYVVQLMSASMNFTVQWQFQNFSDDTDLSANHVYLHLQTDLHRRGKPGLIVWLDDYCLLVPVYPVRLVVLRLGVLFVLLNVVAHVLLTYATVKLLRFDPSLWRPHRLLQVLLGGGPPAIQLNRARASDRMFYLCLVAVSFRYSCELYSMMTNLSINQFREGPYQALEDVLRSDLVVEMDEVHYAMTFRSSDDDESMKQLEAKIRNVSDIERCAARLLDRRRGGDANKVGCLMDRSAAWMQLRRLRGSTTTARMRLIEPALWSAPKGLLFAEASPYLREVRRILRWVFEAGFDQRWWRSLPPTVDGRRDEEEDDDVYSLITSKKSDDQFLWNKLATIWCFGVALAGLAFASELLTWSVNRLVKRRCKDARKDARDGGGGSRFVRRVRRAAKCYFFLNRREIVVAMPKKGRCFFFYFRSLLFMVALDPIDCRRLSEKRIRKIN